MGRGTYLPPDHPRAIFAGDAERELEARRAGTWRSSPDPSGARPRFTAPQRRDATATTTSPEADLDVPEADLDALRARAAAHAPAATATSRELPDPGEIVADLSRPDGTVLRVAVKRWHNPEAKPGEPGAVFVDLRVWNRGWPVKGKGVTVKPRELAALASALLDAADRVRAQRGTR